MLQEGFRGEEEGEKINADGWSKSGGVQSKAAHVKRSRCGAWHFAELR